MGLAISWTAPGACIKFLHTVHVTMKVVPSANASAMGSKFIFCWSKSYSCLPGYIRKVVVSFAPARTIVFLTFFVSGGMVMMTTEWIPCIVVRRVKNSFKEELRIEQKLFF
jgi:hypothetical protein